MAEADFVAAHAYLLEGDGANYAIFSLYGEIYACVNISSGGGAFSPSDVIEVYGPHFDDDPFEYMGFFQNGWIGMWGVLVVLFTNSHYNPGDPITLSTGSFTTCFLAGTAIACPGGARPIEDLAVGDLVRTADGSVRPVRFVGRQAYVTLFADPLRTRPVRIMAGALGEGLPARDLCVSPDHALLVDGVLVQAGALVNGTTIARMTDLPERFTYFHVELEDHSLILAEGVPAETFVDNVTRQRFDNYEDYEALYGEAAATIAELDLPRIKSARQLPAAVRQRLQERADELVGTPAATAA